ncbi:ubiquitin domain-containing protein [Reticulomyxa filosa]|uniref:Ubiquitin domain-containing protein n=1 Tax=Reticulomyxa filosa TaxID=46433 RepID=X6MYA1_RETFI|nr:ubiquitin domain-containing protein [Reticulomyxa filosa]|eukprot:ETO19000.1 ubiquitin domain-containing protein [Reticulomyxa filosa]
MVEQKTQQEQTLQQLLAMQKELAQQISLSQHNQWNASNNGNSNNNSNDNGNVIDNGNLCGYPYPFHTYVQSTSSHHMVSTRILHSPNMALDQYFATPKSNSLANQRAFEMSANTSTFFSDKAPLCNTNVDTNVNISISNATEFVQAAEDENVQSRDKSLRFIQNEPDYCKYTSTSILLDCDSVFIDSSNAPTVTTKSNCNNNNNNNNNNAVTMSPMSDNHIVSIIKATGDTVENVEPNVSISIPTLSLDNVNNKKMASPTRSRPNTNASARSIYHSASYFQLCSQPATERESDNDEKAPTVPSRPCSSRRSPSQAQLSFPRKSSPFAVHIMPLDNNQVFFFINSKLVLKVYLFVFFHFACHVPQYGSQNSPGRNVPSSSSSSSSKHKIHFEDVVTEIEALPAGQTISDSGEESGHEKQPDQQSPMHASSDEEEVESDEESYSDSFAPSDQDHETPILELTQPLPEVTQAQQT